MGLAYERSGSGPPLVLLHGVGHRRQAWGAVLDRLTPHRDVIAVDLPGHGESPPLEQDLPVLDTPERIADLLREENRAYEVEHFQVVLLNTRRKLIRIEKISQGTLDTILVHPREVFKLAIAANAAAVVLAHNHPSGDPSPSEADIKVTRDLIRAGQLLKIEVLDHVIIGRSTLERPKDYASLRELGYFYT